MAFAQVVFGCGYQLVEAFGIAPLDHGEPVFGQEVVGERDGGRLAVDLEWFLAALKPPRIEAVERPVAALYRQFHLAQALRQFVAMFDTGRVGDDHRNAIIRFGFLDGVDGLDVAGAVGA